MERQYYLWTAGGSTVSVAFTPDVITRLREAAGIAPNDDAAEIGGILLGRQQSESSISVEDFQLLPSEHRRGLTFTLSQTDRKKLGQLLVASHHGLQSVGSFRTHLRQGLYMDQYDFELMSSHFASPTDVMLLVRPNDWQAGVFVWEEGDIHRQKSYLEFPFDPAILPLTALVTEDEAAPKPRVVVPRKPAAAAVGPLLPTLAKAGLIAATLGVVGVLAFYAHKHRTLDSVLAKSEVVQSQLPSTVPAKTLHSPVDPDLSKPNADLSEMHVKLPPASDRPSPFAPVLRPSQVTSPAPMKSVPARKIEELPQPATPPNPPPMQTAVNLPSAIMAPVILTPPRTPLVSVVSVEPAEPGIISRGINKVPVLNLLQRHKYRAGDKFSPARPVRQVKPRLPAELEPDNGSPSPVDVKVWIDKTGQVTKAELISDNSEPEVADIAANAALKWTFEPARLSDRPVSSEMVMHFRFAPKQLY